MGGVSIGILAEKSTKNQIIQVLSEEWPLSAKKIHNLLSRKHSTNSTYQAVHKAVSELVADSVLSKESNEYRLNPVWIEKTKELSEHLSKIYEMNSKGSNIALPTLYDVDKFLLNTMLNNPPKEGEKPFLGLHWCHFWVPLFFSISEYRKIAELLPKYDLYAISRGDTKIDRWCGKFWGGKGTNHKTGVDCAHIADLIIYKDMVIQVFYPQEIRKELDSFYSKNSSPEDLDAYKLFENIFQKPTKINITITQNPELAEQLKEETLNYFEGGKK